MALGGLVGVRLSGILSPATVYHLPYTGFEDGAERYTSGREDGGLDGLEMEPSWCEEPGVGLGWARMSRGEASVGSGVGLVT